MPGAVFQHIRKPHLPHAALLLSPMIYVIFDILLVQHFVCSQLATCIAATAIALNACISCKGVTH